MIKRNDILTTLDKNQAKIKFYGVKCIGIFGSYVNGFQRKTSDVDILVEFQPSKKTFDNYMELKELLEGILHKKVDLVLKTSIKPRIKNRILQETLYARL